MKIALIVAALLSVAFAQRQSSKDVISAFREVARLYDNSTKEINAELAETRRNASDINTKFHLDIISVKENFTLSAIDQEDRLHLHIAYQPESVDRLCLSFVNTSLEMNINLAGVGYTNCINRADEQSNNITDHHYKTIGVQEAQIAKLRLLDVFRGDNVFYTPHNIINKLNNKRVDQSVNIESVTTDLHQANVKYDADLKVVLAEYKACMTQGQELLKRGIDLVELQIVFTCNGQEVYQPA